MADLERWGIRSRAGGGTGAKLFFVAPDLRIHSVEVRPGEAFEAGAPRPLFATQMFMSPMAGYDVTADGQRFLVNEFVRSEEAEPITLVVDWPAALKKK